ncbi:MAG: hypothetical protein ACI9P5_004125 [Saprospiraceae bacterium]|jgi:hypothetical protein|tara:strand:- start:203 stop:340 length:138 start_codon:yes stop_codon:yes gene_type:complete
MEELLASFVSLFASRDILTHFDVVNLVDKPEQVVPLNPEQALPVL